MSWRRKKKGQGGHGSRAGGQAATPSSQASPAPHEPPAAPSAGPAPGRRRAQPVETFKVVFEQVADAAKSRLASAGKVGLMAFFIYGEQKQPGPLQASTTKVVDLAWRSEFYKELLRKKVREKTRAEGPLAVIVLTDGKAERRDRRSEGSPPRKGTVHISGATPRAQGGASLNYTYEQETKSFTFGELEWVDEPPRNFFLEGIFREEPSSATGGTKPASLS